jgi:hypothetical protein
MLASADRVLGQDSHLFIRNNSRCHLLRLCRASHGEARIVACIVQPKILSMSPSPVVLLPPRFRIVRQKGIAIVAKVPPHAQI